MPDRDSTSTLSAAVPLAAAERFRAIAAEKGSTPSTLLRSLVLDYLDAGRDDVGPVEAAVVDVLDGRELLPPDRVRAAAARSLARRLDQGAASAAQTAAELARLMDAISISSPDDFDPIARALATPDEPFDPSRI
ncbi:hypothetical protein [Nocardioides sp.]|uniref:hypothetical protein n=1 Tax=Nocardioides sp. TaxID=35761 RepID=UPI00351257CC